MNRDASSPGGRARLEAVRPVLMSRDVGAAIRFYESLGFRSTFRDDAADPKYAAVARDSVELHLQWHDASAFPPGADRPTYRVLVRDVDALHAELLARGALEGSGESPWRTPGDTPWGTREFHVRDLDGNGLQFCRPL